MNLATAKVIAFNQTRESILELLKNPAVILIPLLKLVMYSIAVLNIFARSN